MAEKEYVEREAVNQLLNQNHDMAHGKQRDVIVWLMLAFRDLVPNADVRPNQEVSDATDEALRILDAMHTSGRLDYSDYCELHDAISAIYGTGAKEAGADGVGDSAL